MPGPGISGQTVPEQPAPGWVARKKSTSMKTRIVLIAAAGVLAGAVVVMAIWFWPGETSISRGTSLQSARSNSAGVAAGLPAATEPDAIRRYLTAAGQPLLTGLHAEAIAQMNAGSSPAQECQERVGRLQRVLPANNSLGLISGVPDEVLKELFGRERVALGIALTRCVTPDDQPNPTETGDGTMALTDSVALTDLRLDALGVVR